MRTALYNLSIQLLKLLLPLGAKFSAKVMLFYKGRKSLLTTIQGDLSTNTHDLFWVHCSSVGEFEQGLPVIELLKKEQPTWKVVVTFFSPSGYEVVNHPIIDYKYYLPYDTPRNASRFVELINPRLAIFVKYEYWYHMLNALHTKQIPTYSVSSIFRPTQTFFKWFGGWNRRMLAYFTHFMVQDEQSVKLLKSIGLTNATQTGDTRFDRVLELKTSKIKFPEIEDFTSNKTVFIIGSLRAEDDEVIFSFINSNPHFTYIIAPHDITEKHMSKIEHALKSTIRHSNLTPQSKAKILIIDSTGKLSKIYQLANFAYIGGGFSDGIHNILEPAVYNIPIFFGNKHYKKYKEAVDLVALEAAFPIESADHLTGSVNRINNEQSLKTLSSRIENYVNSNRGAAQKVVSIINRSIAK